jgi:hypothetical protein
MPRTYVKGLLKVEAIFLSSFPPNNETVTDIIGYTQGVKFKANPIKKMLKKVQRYPWLLNMDAI